MHKVQTSIICTEHLHYESSNKFNHLNGHSKKKKQLLIKYKIGGLGSQYTEAISKKFPIEYQKIKNREHLLNLVTVLNPVDNWVTSRALYFLT